MSSSSARFFSSSGSRIVRVIFLLPGLLIKLNIYAITKHQVWWNLVHFTLNDDIKGGLLKAPRLQRRCCWLAEEQDGNKKLKLQKNLLLELTSGSQVRPNECEFLRRRVELVSFFRAEQRMWETQLKRSLCSGWMLTKACSALVRFQKGSL